MNSEHKNETTTESSTASSRRKFLQKTSAGVVIASIPAKSVWATNGGGGILNSIAASTNASGWTGGCMYLLSQGFWGNPNGKARAKAVTFRQAFGLGAEPKLDSAKAKWSHSGRLKYLHGQSWITTDITKDTLTLYDVVTNTNFMANVSVQISAMYLNAKHNGEDGLHFPVWNATTHRPFASLQSYADWLYANINTPGFGSALDSLILSNHVGNAACIN